MKQEIPQDVLDRIMDILKSREWGDKLFPDAARELIEAAQLPIAAPTKPEIDQLTREMERDALGVASVLGLFIDRRNSPPQVDALEEKTITFGIMTSDCSECGAIVDCFGRTKHIAWHKKIASAVREAKNG